MPQELKQRNPALSMHDLCTPKAPGSSLQLTAWNRQQTALAGSLNLANILHTTCLGVEGGWGLGARLTTSPALGQQAPSLPSQTWLLGNMSLSFQGTGKALTSFLEHLSQSHPHPFLLPPLLISVLLLVLAYLFALPSLFAGEGHFAFS